MKNLRKRNELPSFQELPYKFNVEAILDVLASDPENFDDLEEPNAYKKVSETCPCLQKTFGIKFNTIEEAYEHLRISGQKIDSMNWDYRKFVNVNGEGVTLKSNPYKQKAITEYNSDFDPGQFEVSLPRNRLDERQYNKIKSWAEGTYLEEVIKTFKGFVTRVRVARMEPGCVIGDHIDYNTDYSIRVHIPLRTNQGCGFYVQRRKDIEKEYIYMPADGRCWFINQGFVHSAWNKGSKPRDHLVISIVGQEDLFL